MKIKEIKKGTKFLCLQDVYVGGQVMYSQGTSYISDRDGYITDNGGDSQYWTAGDAFYSFFKEEAADNVNHPSHYTSHPSGVECIEITRHYCFSIGNAIKYLWRAGLKNDAGLSDLDKEIEDLEKAKWYIQDRINQLEKIKRDAESKGEASSEN